MKRCSVRFWLFLALLAPAMAGAETATFAGGCFWCVEEAFDKVPGVTRTTSGFANGNILNPTYKQVSAGGTGFTEAVQVEFDAAKVSYAQLLDIFWHNHDPVDAGGQFCDRGSQYRAAIFYNSDSQRQQAEASRTALQQAQPFKGTVVTRIEPLKNYYPAEEYHQDYHAKNPIRYRYYKYRCGRPARLEALWGKAE